jgi:hypothetical protein
MNEKTDEPRLLLMLFPLLPLPFFFFTLVLCPPTPSFSSSLPRPEPSRVAPTTCEDGGARQEQPGDVAHVRCVCHAEERALRLALHTAGESVV